MTRRIALFGPRALTLALFALSLLAACAPTTARAPKQRLPTPAGQSKAGPEHPPPELIEVRVLVVAYEGAAMANPTLHRTKAEAEERARMLARMAKSGDKLAELVRKYSDRPGASEDLGLFRLRPAQPGVFGEAVSKAAGQLEPAEISDPVDAPEGYFVIERRADPPTGPARIGAKHILISYKGAEHAITGVTRSESEARVLAEEIARKAKGGADWNGLAAQYTDEPGSKETGGDLGKFGHGQMVKSFELAAFALPVGQVSDVVQSPFGFHIILRYE
jgi:peptidyl-prolyl cis-trans isomerase NIMA-interacting 1